MGRADLHRLSRLEGVRTAAQRAGHRGARDAEHHGDISALAAIHRAAPKICTCKIEAQKLAYADLRRYIADPRFSQVPVTGLLSKEYAAKSAPR